MRPIYRVNRDDLYDLRVAIRHADNGDEIGLTPRQQVMARALRMTCTARQVETMQLYFVVGLPQEAVGRQMDIDCSNVSRNIRNGLRHIEQALRLSGERALSCFMAGVLE